MPADLRGRIEGRSIHFPLRVHDFDGELDEADVLLWDNRCCAHRRESFDPAERRLLYGTPLVASDILWRPAVAA